MELFLCSPTCAQKQQPNFSWWSKLDVRKVLQGWLRMLSCDLFAVAWSDYTWKLDLFSNIVRSCYRKQIARHHSTWQMEFNIDKCKVMHVGKTNIHSIYHMSNTVIGEPVKKKDLGVFVSDDLKVSKHCAYAYSRQIERWALLKEHLKLGIVGYCWVCTRRWSVRICSIALQPGLHTTKETKTPWEGTTSLYKTVCWSEESNLWWETT